jgi:Fe(3+) dicitrate transport protein
MRLLSLAVLATVTAATMLPGRALTAQVAPLTGRVVDAETGRPVEAAQLALLPGGPSVLSDVDGRFRFGRVVAGSWTLRVRRLGYAPWEQPLRPDAAADILVVRLRPAAQHVAGITVVGPGQGDLVRIPGSATLIDETQLAQTQPLSANEMLRLVPGVHVQEEEMLGLRANVGVRGLDPDRSRTVLMLEDGVPVALAPYGEPEMYYTPPIDRMARVEVVKGSGSVLFGPQTIGGVVNFVTPDPPARASGTLAAHGGTGGFGLARLGWGGRWEGTGLIGSVLRRRVGDIRGLSLDQTDVTAKLTADLGPRHAAALKLSIYDEESNATYVGLTDSIYRADPDYRPAPDDRLRIRRYAVTATHEAALGAGRTVRTAVYGYTTTRDWQRQDYGYSASGNDYVFRNSTGNRDRSFDVAGLEPRLRLVHRLGEFEGGVRGHYERARDQHINGQTATSPTGEIRDDEIRTGWALAAFAQNRFALTERLRLTPGVRVEYFAYRRHILRTRVRREVLDSTGALVGVTREPEDVDLRSSDALVEVIPGIGASWLASDRLTVFAGAHRGFAPPRVKDALVYDERVYAPDEDPGDPVSLQLDAERSWNVELGARAQPLPGVQLEATLFALDFSNQIIEPSLSAGSVAQAQLANQGETRHRGGEAALAVDWGVLARWTTSVRTDVRYTITDARFANDRFMVAPAGDTVNVRGNRLPYAPRHLLNASLAIARPGFTVRLDGVRVGEHFADNFETRTPSPNGRNGVIPAHTVWSAAASAAIPGTRLRVSGTAKNLLDATYVASRRPEGIKPGLPRQVHIGLDWAF